MRTRREAPGPGPEIKTTAGSSAASPPTACTPGAASPTPRPRSASAGSGRPCRWSRGTACATARGSAPRRPGADRRVHRRRPGHADGRGLPDPQRHRSREPSDEPRPVMVWFYGGAFVVGSASAPTYRGYDLRPRATSSTSASTTASARSATSTSRRTPPTSARSTPTSGCATRSRRWSGCATTSRRSAATRTGDDLRRVRRRDLGDDADGHPRRPRALPPRDRRELRARHGLRPGARPAVGRAASSTRSAASDDPVAGLTAATPRGPPARRERAARAPRRPARHHPDRTRRRRRPAAREPARRLRGRPRGRRPADHRHQRHRGAALRAAAPEAGPPDHRRDRRPAVHAHPARAARAGARGLPATPRTARTSAATTCSGTRRCGSWPRTADRSSPTATTSRRPCSTSWALRATHGMELYAVFGLAGSGAARVLTALGGGRALRAMRRADAAGLDALRPPRRRRPRTGRPTTPRPA